MLKEKTANEEDLIEFVEESIKAEEVSVENGFHNLERYIDVHVYQDVNLNMSRLRQLKRNLMPWKEQLQNNFIDPEKQSLEKSPFFDNWKENAERMKGKIVAALEVIELRIKDKEMNQASSKFLSSDMDVHEIERIVLRKGVK